MPEPRPSRRRGGALCALALALASLLTATVTAPAAGAPAPGRPAAHGPGDDRPVVTTDHGPVRGRAHGAYDTFEGIPFAAPPTGPLRWRDPQPAPPWREVRDAGAPGPQCPQFPPLGSGPATGSEDCLTLNVTAPSGRAKGRARPVMVWVHGGGFMFGAGSPYRAEQLAVQGDTVVVTLNYRLGVLGFFGHPELRGATNFGLADQRAALRWVKANAARFGGDPGRVTLFGESAGSLSTCAQLASPDSAGLFHRAALQSGSCMTAFPPGAILPTLPRYEPFVPRSRTEAAGTAAATTLGCARPGGTLDCLRALGTDKLVTPELMQTFSLVSYGGGGLPLRPDRALEKGRFHRVPVVQGTTRDEMRLFLALTQSTHPIRDAREYRARLVRSFGMSAGAVEARYPLASYPSPGLAWGAVMSDVSFTCGALRADRALAARVPTYAYLFADTNAPRLPELPAVEGYPYGAAHGFELPYLFPMDTEPRFSPEQRALADRMTGYWTRFAASGDPNSPGAPGWPRFGGAATVLSLAPGAGGIKPVDAAAAHHCAFWDRLAR
ncbi:carboxylesterase/lipase family protein [Streptomyces albireticuli]|uniref:Carboxylic ester hydrolase n=1 Tax=Streptomyces albireticuli TaxID=1940 RepID=A0A2A2D6V5_9ACTN|nr:carboxylesterase family protein [Streptomyces albireticuli]MCD9143166.1 carboxylesterase family protein [Streptomyces albireticuli]MCD9163608.1 carboxylesterase family protein [Streptomyces albireticuli]MCD9191283.1 carboxylesterase family protein [Streptomyces albireticuli]PAU47245.1 carboxylesterase [Streptomyces albireticuli]